MTYVQCEAQLKTQLLQLYDAGETAAIANWVLEEYTGQNRHMRKVAAAQEISADEVAAIGNATNQLLQGKPLQYVLGYADFYGLRFQVNESVLIPRPETEELVDRIIKDCKRKQGNLQILDIGTGSGCIPISLKKHLPIASVTAVDISSAALEIATKNAAFQEVNIRLLDLDFLIETNWQQLEKYDVIVSNPPYIPQQEKEGMAQHVTAWEPATALFVPNERPLLFYEQIAQFSKEHLQANGSIYLETHKDFAQDVQQLFTDGGYKTELKKDMHGNERMVKAVINN